MIYDISIWLLPVLIAVTFHEAAHGYVARSLGDETASRLGRVSLNPLRHIDPFGTIVLPGLLLLAHSPFLFGYAKPVPVNFRALRNPRSGMVLVAVAGRAMNIGLAIIAALSFLNKSRRTITQLMANVSFPTQSSPANVHRRTASNVGAPDFLLAGPLRLTLVEKRVQSFAKIPAHVAHEDKILAFLTRQPLLQSRQRLFGRAQR